MKIFAHRYCAARLATGGMLGVLSATLTMAAFAAPHWSGDVALNCETCRSESESHDIAVDPWGNGLVVWAEIGPDFAQTVHAVRYDNITRTWSRPVRLGASTRSKLEVSMDQYGNARAIWVERIGFNPRIMTARYSAATRSWGAPTVAYDPGGRRIDVDSLRFEMDRQGNGMLMWQEYAGIDENDNSIFSVMARRYHAGTKRWESPVRLDSGTSLSFHPDLAVDPAGNAVVVWASQAGIQWRRFRPATGMWGTRRMIDSSAGTALPQVGLAHSGGGIALWLTRAGLYSARYDPIKNIWSAPLQVSTFPAARTHRDFSVDGKGNAFLVVGATVQRYNAATGYWSTPKRLSQNVTSVEPELGSFPKVSSDMNGNALVIWRESVAGSARVTASRYSANLGFWSTPVRLHNASTARAPAVTYGGNNRAIAAWTQFTGNHLQHPDNPDVTIPIFNVHVNAMTP